MAENTNPNIQSIRSASGSVWYNPNFGGTGYIPPPRVAVSAAREVPAPAGFKTGVSATAEPLKQMKPTAQARPGAPQKTITDTTARDKAERYVQSIGLDPSTIPYFEKKFGGSVTTTASSGVQYYVKPPPRVQATLAPPPTSGTQYYVVNERKYTPSILNSNPTTPARTGGYTLPGLNEARSFYAGLESYKQQRRAALEGQGYGGQFATAVGEAGIGILELPKTLRDLGQFQQRGREKLQQTPMTFEKIATIPAKIAMVPTVVGTAAAGAISYYSQRPGEFAGQVALLGVGIRGFKLPKFISTAVKIPEPPVYTRTTARVIAATEKGSLAKSESLILGPNQPGKFVVRTIESVKLPSGGAKTASEGIIFDIGPKGPRMPKLIRDVGVTSPEIQIAKQRGAVSLGGGTISANKFFGYDLSKELYALSTPPETAYLTKGKIAVKGMEPIRTKGFLKVRDFESSVGHPSDMVLGQTAGGGTASTRTSRIIRIGLTQGEAQQYIRADTLKAIMAGRKTSTITVRPAFAFPGVYAKSSTLQLSKTLKKEISPTSYGRTRAVMQEETVFEPYGMKPPASISSPKINERTLFPTTTGVKTTGITGGLVSSGMIPKTIITPTTKPVSTPYTPPKQTSPQITKLIQTPMTKSLVAPIVKEPTRTTFGSFLSFGNFIPGRAFFPFLPSMPGGGGGGRRNLDTILRGPKKRYTPDLTSKILNIRAPRQPKGVLGRGVFTAESPRPIVSRGRRNKRRGKPWAQLI